MNILRFKHWCAGATGLQIVEGLQVGRLGMHAFAAPPQAAQLVPRQARKPPASTSTRQGARRPSHSNTYSGSYSDLNSLPDSCLIEMLEAMDPIECNSVDIGKWNRTTLLSYILVGAGMHPAEMISLKGQGAPVGNNECRLSEASPAFPRQNSR